MGLSDKGTSFQPRIKIGSQELDHIIQTRENLEEVTALAQYAMLYKSLGWLPVALDAQTGICLNVDFGQPQQNWLNFLMDLALKKTRVSLAIHLKPDSQLFVLKVSSVFAKEFLDSLGDWRSLCTARLGNIWENHFLIMPQNWGFSAAPDQDGEDVPMSVMGPGKVVVLPPSVDQSYQEAWRWPPMQQPPRYPSPALLLLLEEAGYICRKPSVTEAGLPTWEDIYPIICRSNKLLQALLASAAASELYYRNILFEALRAGFRDPRMLQALLWHAPHSEMRHHPEGLQELSRWAAEIRGLLSAEILNSEEGSPGLSYPAGLPHVAFAPGAETDKVNPGEGPGSTRTSSPPQSSPNELNFLATFAAELERQVDELEEQLAAADNPGGGVSTSFTLQKNEGEFEELRRVLEKFLSKDHD